MSRNKQRKLPGKAVVKMPMPKKGETVFEDHVTGAKYARDDRKLPLKRGGKKEAKKTLNKAQPPGGSTKSIRDKMYRTDI